MSNLQQIAQRHGWDRWKDAAFIALAVLLTAVSIGATTSKAVGDPVERTYTIQLVDPETNVAIK
jgi:hypothetical protein